MYTKFINFVLFHVYLKSNYSVERDVNNNFGVIINQLVKSIKPYN